MDIPVTGLSAQCHIQYHHEHESCCHSHRAYVGMCPRLCFRNQFLYDDIDHRSGRKGQEVREQRDYKAGQEDREQCAAAGSTIPESAP